MTNSATPSTLRNPSASDRISEAVQRLRQMTQLNVQPGWRSYLGELPIAQATQANHWQQWTGVALNDRGHIAWDKGEKVLWLGQRIVVPENLQGYCLQGLSLRLALTWWATDAQIYVNGKLVQQGDLFDAVTRILLLPVVQSEDAIEVAMRLVSPGHDPGALVQSVCQYERADQSLNPPEPSFVADELAVLQNYLIAFAPEKLDQVAAAVDQLPWSVLTGTELTGTELTGTDRASFDQELVALRQQLQPLSNFTKQRQLQLLGHAHLDLAWLWPVSETWEAAERTFKSALQLQQDFSELTFGHSTPALYAWMETHRPELFTKIQSQIAAGRWEVIAGLWIEPELNVINGESIARHVLYGQRYVQEKFGRVSKIAWLPDTFGFCWQLPQILIQGEVEYFVTQKLRWNDTTQFPYEVFWWQSPDGSRILSLNSAPIGEGIDPVKMAQYACTWETKTGLQASLWLPGVGDHGGGPTRDMLETARRWQRSPFFPKMQFGTAQQFLDETRQQATAPSSPLPASCFPLPTWNDELFLEFHRGCYTTHADQKWWNRRCEEMLYEAELFASIAALLLKHPYPQTAIETAWKQVLFNHFHDILPGTAIPQVFVDANWEWETAAKTSQEIRDTALRALMQHMQLPDRPHPQAQAIVVFNSLNWTRSEVVTVSWEQPGFAGQTCYWQICDLAGQTIDSQVGFENRNGKYYWSLSFLAENIAGIGYRCFWLCPSSTGRSVTQSYPSDAFVLENEYLQVTVDPETGNLSQLSDRIHQRTMLSQAGNQLQAFRDSGQYWDAWNIDPNYAQFPLPAAQLVKLQYEAKGSIVTRIRVIRKLGQSTFNQVYVLEKGSPVLKIQTQVDWQERHVLVKAAFPLNIDAAYATYEMPFGAIQRSTRPKTDAEKAKWEVPALRWADLSDTASNDSYGFSILSDGKHGYDSTPNQIRLTLLRSPTWPDPDADRGLHQFTYAVYAHDRNWQAAQTVQRGYELNQPLRVLPIASTSPSASSSVSLPAIGQFLNLSASHLVLSAFKRSEDHPHQWVLRCYDAQGQATSLNWQESLNSMLGQLLDSKSVQRTNLLETPQPDPEGDNLEGNNLAGKDIVPPWTIATFVLNEIPHQ